MLAAAVAMLPTRVSILFVKIMSVGEGGRGREA